MLWRFRPAFEEDDTIVLVRDADSRLSRRERAAVEDWLASDFDFHIMRDHAGLHRHLRLVVDDPPQDLAVGPGFDAVLPVLLYRSGPLASIRRKNAPR
jgi:hypothetical protein